MKKEKTSTVSVHTFDTPIGEMTTASTSRGLAVIWLPKQKKKDFNIRLNKMFGDFKKETGGRINKQAEKEIKEFLRGKRTIFKVKLDLHKTDFHKKVLQKVASIPYGKTKTYGEIARSVGNPKAYRAVGSANARNDLPLIIPCHRVVATNGLGGYAGGLPLKKKLLEFESMVGGNNLFN